MDFATSATLLLLASSAFLAYASDPSPLQDFCVAVNDLKETVFVNGKVCKDPKMVKSDDFFISGLNIPGDTKNPLGLAVTAATVDQLPGLNTLGISLVRIDYDVNGVAPPHTHPRGTEILTVIKGILYVGFVTSSPGNQLFSKTLYPGDVFVFPQGLVHFQYNVGNTTAVAIAALGSQNPGLIFVADALFSSQPLIPTKILAKSLQTTESVITELEGHS